MVLTPLVIGIGLVIGLVRGGRLDAVRRTRVSLWPILLVGILLQTVGESFDLPGRAAVVMLGLVCLVAVAMRNLHIPGTAVAGIGITLNLAVLVVNGHVPVRFEALTAFGKNIALSPTGLWELETDTTSLAFLGDIVPIPVLEIPISFGDLIMLAGLMVIAMNIVLQGRVVGIGVDELLADALVDEPLESVVVGAVPATAGAFALDPFDAFESDPWSDDRPPAVSPILIGTTEPEPAVELDLTDTGTSDGADTTDDAEPIDLRSAPAADTDVRRALFDDIPDLADAPLDWADSGSDRSSGS